MSLNKQCTRTSKINRYVRKQHGRGEQEGTKEKGKRRRRRLSSKMTEKSIHKSCLFVFVIHIDFFFLFHRFGTVFFLKIRYEKRKENALCVQVFVCSITQLMKNEREREEERKRKMKIERFGIFCYRIYVSFVLSVVYV